jgi:hypothetical protein
VKRLRRGLIAALFGLSSLYAVSAPAWAANEDLCKPGKTNVGGGPGASGPGDKKGAPLKVGPDCPGTD